jgi:integrase
LKVHPERYWIVMLCLYAGLRREEAAQLLVSQVVKDQDTGIWYLDIRADQGGGQSLKNESSTRRVPIHAALITSRLDFLAYVTKTAKAGHSRLFWQCQKTASGYGDKAGQWFGRLLHTTLKFPNTHVLHSLRHGWITGLHAAGVPDQLVFALCGHTAAGGEVHARYTHRESFPLKSLSEAVNKLDFGLTRPATP